MGVTLGNFFGPPTLTSHNFAASKDMIMIGRSFESPKPYLFALAFALKNSIAVLLSYVILGQTDPTYVVCSLLIL